MNTHRRSILSRAAALFASTCLIAGCGADSAGGDEEQALGESRAAISADTGHPVWGVDMSGNVWAYSGGSNWVRFPGGLKRISVGGSRVWGINASGTIYWRNGVNGDWTQVPGALADIAAGVDDEVWGINASGMVYQWDGSDWAAKPGILKQISVGSAKQVWGVNPAGDLFQWSDAAQDWQRRTAPAGLLQVSVGADGTVCAVDGAGHIFRRKDDGSWITLPGGLAEVSVASSIEIWGANGAGQIYRWVTASNDWELLPGGQLAWVSVSAPPTGRIGSFFGAAGSSASSMVHSPLELSYGRGAGTVLDTCDPGWELDGALCYPTCDNGYTGVGPVCWEKDCDSGYTDYGATCTYNHGLPTSCDMDWFTCNCPHGYVDAGLFCAAKTYTKSSYGRGAGVVPHCGSGEEKDGALCYPKCEAGYKGVGPVCWLRTDIDGICQALYDPRLAGGAKGVASMTYGFGLGFEAGATESVEAGVVYGPKGEYGCYVTTCMGAATNVSVAAWGAVSVLNESFAAVAGEDYVVFAGEGDVVGVTLGSVFNPSHQYVGLQSSVNLSAGELPVEAGLTQCTTTVNQLW